MEYIHASSIFFLFSYREVKMSVFLNTMRSTLWVEAKSSQLTQLHSLGFVPSRCFMYNSSTLANYLKEKQILPSPAPSRYCSNQSRNTIGNVKSIVAWTSQGNNIYKIGGGIGLIAIGLAGASYLYCANDPDHELCESVRSYFGIKKK